MFHTLKAIRVSGERERERERERGREREREKERKKEEGFLFQDVHSFNFIHRDIKPSNFCIGFEDRYRRIFVIDFGCAKKIETKKWAGQFIT